MVYHPSKWSQSGWKYISKKDIRRNYLKKKDMIGNYILKRSKDDLSEESQSTYQMYILNYSSSIGLLEASKEILHL